jgi:2,3-bisphosphoglycerate-independent phosphoglycerate mutase
MEGCYVTPHDNSGKDISALYRNYPDFLINYMDKAHAILAKSSVNDRRIQKGKWPANHVWLFWPGIKASSMAPFEKKYGKSAAVNSAVDLLDGMATLADMKIYKFDGVSDGPTNDFAAQGKGAIKMLEDGNDVVFIHIEAPDAAGHDGHPLEKKNAVEQSDALVIGPLRAYAQAHPLRIAVMPDHPTPLSTRKHGRQPVPFVVWGQGIARAQAPRMTEDCARKTGVRFDPGYKLLGEIILS